MIIEVVPTGPSHGISDSASALDAASNTDKSSIYLSAETAQDAI